MEQTHSEKVNEFWNLFDKLSGGKQCEECKYMWESFGDSLMEQVREWDIDVLDESIQELKERLK